MVSFIPHYQYVLVSRDMARCSRFKLKVGVPFTRHVAYYESLVVHVNHVAGASLPGLYAMDPVSFAAATNDGEDKAGSFSRESKQDITCGRRKLELVVATTGLIRGKGQFVPTFMSRNSLVDGPPIVPLNSSVPLAHLEKCSQRVI